MFIIITVHSCWFKSNLIKIYMISLFCFIILWGVFISFLLCYYFTGKNRHFKFLITFRNATDEDGCYSISYLCLWYSRGVFFLTFTSAPKSMYTHIHNWTSCNQDIKPKLISTRYEGTIERVSFIFVVFLKKNVISTIGFYRY